MARWALILSLVVGSGTWCAGQAKPEDNERNWLATLLNPDIPPLQARHAFDKLELRENHKRREWAIDRLTEKLNKLDDAVADRARWALWCLAGPDRYHAITSKRPLRPLAPRAAERVPRPFDLELNEVVGKHIESLEQAVLREINLTFAVRSAGLSEAQVIQAKWRASVEEAASVWNPHWGDPLEYAPPDIPSLFSLQMMVDEPWRHDELLVAMEKRLASHVLGVPTSTAELSRKLTGPTRDRFVARLLELILIGRSELFPLLREAQVTKDEASRLTIAALTHGAPNTRRAVVKILKETGWEGTDTAAALLAVARSLDPQASREAADLLGTEEALHLARVSQLLCALRDQSKVERVMAAVRLNELAIYPKPITTALVKAAEEGNLVVREGIVAALEEAFLSNRHVNITLNELAKRRDVQGVSARAALAAVRE